MSSLRERLQTVRSIAAEFQKPFSEVAGIVAKSAGWTTFERAEVEHELSIAPEARDPDKTQAARQKADERQLVDTDRADVTSIERAREFRRLNDANPFEAASYLERHAVDVDRGLSLDTDPEPPAAA